MAFDMALQWQELAYARDHLNNDTALHILAMAHDQNPLDSCCHCSEQQTPIMINPGKFLLSCSEQQTPIMINPDKFLLSLIAEDKLKYTNQRQLKPYIYVYIGW